MGVNVIDRDRKAEASMPVQARVDIRTLAELTVYWYGEEKVNINSISQLISYSIDALREALINNGMLPREIDSIEEAFNYMTQMGLYKGAMASRGKRKMLTARGFEQIRLSGGNPKFEAPGKYNQMHNKRSAGVSDLSRMAIEKAAREKEKKMKEDVKKNMERLEFDEDGMMRPRNVVDDQNYEEPTDNVGKVARNIKVGKASDVPRMKTEDELNDEEDRIRKKDEKLLNNISNSCNIKDR